MAQCHVSLKTDLTGNYQYQLETVGVLGKTPFILKSRGIVWGALGAWPCRPPPGPLWLPMSLGSPISFLSMSTRSSHTPCVGCDPASPTVCPASGTELEKRCSWAINQSPGTPSWVQEDLFYFSSDVSMFSLPLGAFHAFES